MTSSTSGTSSSSTSPTDSVPTTSSVTSRSSTPPAQIEQLARIVDELGIDVNCFGITADFRTELFPGSKRLFELADRVQVLQVAALCWCGARATHNARLIDGVMVVEGEQVVVGDTAAQRQPRRVRSALPPPLHAPDEQPCGSHGLRDAGRPALRPRRLRGASARLSFAYAAPLLRRLAPGAQSVIAGAPIAVPLVRVSAAGDEGQVVVPPRPPPNMMSSQLGTLGRPLRPEALRACRLRRCGRSGSGARLRARPRPVIVGGLVGGVGGLVRLGLVLRSSSGSCRGRVDALGVRSSSSSSSGARRPRAPARRGARPRGARHARPEVPVRRPCRSRGPRAGGRPRGGTPRRGCAWGRSDGDRDGSGSTARAWRP